MPASRRRFLQCAAAGVAGVGGVDGDPGILTNPAGVDLETAGRWTHLREVLVVSAHTTADGGLALHQDHFLAGLRRLGGREQAPGQVLQGPADAAEAADQLGVFFDLQNDIHIGFLG